MKKRIVCFTTMLLCLLLFSLPVSAAPEDDVTVAFGDSIVAGYALDGYSGSSDELTKDSFLQLWADDHGLKVNESVYCFAKTGYTSENILASVKKADKDTLSKAKVVLFTAGGNDVMDTYGEFFMKAIMSNMELIQKYNLQFNVMDHNATEKSILSVLSDPDKKELVDTLVGYCTNEEAQSTYQTMISNYEANLRAIVETIRKVNPDAEIVIMSTYDPLQSIDPPNGLTSSVGETIQEMDKRALALMQDSSCNHHLHVISLLNDFEGKYQDWTFIGSKSDIHPSVEGHAEIFRLLKAELDTNTEQSSAAESSAESSAQSTAQSAVTESSGTSEPSAPASSRTEKKKEAEQAAASVEQESVSAPKTNIPANEIKSESPNFVPYILCGVACICVAAIVIVFVIKRVRTKKSSK